MPSKVLIVDDDKTTREGLAELLEESGYERDRRRHVRGSDARPALEPARSVDRRRPSRAVQRTAARHQQSEADPRDHHHRLRRPRARGGRAPAWRGLRPQARVAARLLDLVAQKLSRRRQDSASRAAGSESPSLGGLDASVEDEPARIVDISYGGVRFEIDRATRGQLPASFSIKLPSAQLSVQAKLVWKNLIGDQTWLCGAASRRRRRNGTASSTRSDAPLQRLPHSSCSTTVGGVLAARHAGPRTPADRPRAGPAAPPRTTSGSNARDVPDLLREQRVAERRCRRGRAVPAQQQRSRA